MNSNVLIKQDISASGPDGAHNARCRESSEYGMDLPHSEDSLSDLRNHL